MGKIVRSRLTTLCTIAEILIVFTKLKLRLKFRNLNQKRKAKKMLNNEIMRNAIEHYAKIRDLTNFKYDGLKGFVAFDLYVTDHEEFGLELGLAYLDHINGIATIYPTIH